MIYWVGLLQPKNEFGANLAKSLPASAARGQNIFRAVPKSNLSSCNFMSLQIAIENRNVHKGIWLYRYSMHRTPTFCTEFKSSLL